MNPQKGYYSLIQFCPDASRLETVNLGVILFCPATGFLEAKTSRNTRRAEKLVDRGELAREALKQAQSAIEQRLKVDRESFQDIDALTRFVATRGNALRLTPPRPVKVFTPEGELAKLFTELVEATTSKSESDRCLFPVLKSLFDRLNDEGRAQINFRSRLPVLDQEFKVPFAYRNGSLNLVKPQRFNQHGSSKALELATRGNLIQKHGLPGEVHSQLVVVSRFESSCQSDFIDHVDRLLSEYQVKHIREGELDQFVQHVDAEAHA